MRSPLYALALSTSVVTLCAAGCGDDGSTDGPVGTDPVTAELAPGSVVRGPGGLALGRPATLTGDAVSVSLEIVEPARPLPDGWAPRGSAFALSAAQDVDNGGDVTGFVVALPVPAGVDPTRVGAAGLTREGSSFEAPTPHWVRLRGQYAAAEGAVLVRVPRLGPTPRTVRLFEAPWIDTPMAQPPRPGAVGSIRVQLVSDIGWADGFALDADGVPAPSEAWMAFHEEMLNAALDDYRDARFVPFQLGYDGLDLWLDPPALSYFGEVKYAVDVRTYRTTPQLADAPCEVSTHPDRPGTIHGVYDPTWDALTLCAPRGAGPDDAEAAAVERGTAYHELFHAEQHVYLSASMIEGQRWFSESTATLAQGLQTSATPTRIGERDPRSVAVSLLDEGSTRDTSGAPYEAQDFWAFAARQNGLDLEGVMAPFLLAGDVTPGAVAAAFSELPFAEDLDETYGKWTQDQVFDACTLDESVTGEITELGDVVFGGSEPDYPAPLTVTLPPLTARVLRLSTANVRTEAARLRVSLSSPLAVVEHSMVYGRLDVGGGCVIDEAKRGTTDTRSNVFELASGDQATIVLVVANGSHDETLSGTVTIERAPLVYTFDDGLEGWVGGVVDGFARAEREESIGDPPGCLMMDGSDFGDPDGEPNAWFTRAVPIPPGTTTLSFTTRATPDGDGALRVRVDGDVIQDWRVLAGDDWVERRLDVSAYAGRTVEVRFEQTDDDVGIGEHRYVDNVTFE